MKWNRDSRHRRLEAQFLAFRMGNSQFSLVFEQGLGHLVDDIFLEFHD